MAAPYYISIRSQTNDYHVVHKEGCPFLPDNDERIFLGMFGTVNAAIKEGQRHFTSIISCLFCLKEYKSKRKKPIFSKPDITTFVPTVDQISQFQKGTRFYFLN